MPITASYTQLEFRVRNDNGNETAATWVEALNTDATLNVDTNYRIRFQVCQVSGSSSSQTFNLYVSINNGAYNAIASGQAAKYSLSSNFAQGDDTTRQLSISETLNWVTDNNGMCESSGAVLTVTNSTYWELEYCIQIDSAYVANGDNLKFRVYRGTTALNAYTKTPSITVAEGGSPPAFVLHSLSMTGCGI